MKKDTVKLCEYCKSPTHKINECRSKDSLVVELKASKSNACSDSEPELDKGNDKGKNIIDVEPRATAFITKVEKTEPEDLAEGEHIFHSQMWVKGPLL